MFAHWMYVPGGPVACGFQGRPETSCQVFVGFIADFWDKPGQRMVDIEVAGKVAGVHPRPWTRWMGDGIMP